MSSPEASHGGSSGTSPAGRSGESPAGLSGSSTARDSALTGETSLASFYKPTDDVELGIDDRITRADLHLRNQADAEKEEETGGYQPDWDGPNDPRNPYNFSEKKKWMITGAALLASFLVPMHGTSITVAAKAINTEFGISDVTFPNSYWPIASWGAGCAVSIIVGLPIMEDFGIKKMFLSTYVLFYIFIIPQAFAQNFTTLVVTRFFSGAFGELPTSAVASIIPDLWMEPKARTLPISLLNLGVMGGLTIAPAIFAPVMEYIQNWRWIIYIQLIMFAILFPILALCLRETRGSIILEKREKKHRRERPDSPTFTNSLATAPITKLEKIKIATTRPFYLLVTEPVLLSISLWSAFSFGNVFLFTQSTEQVFFELYDWRFYQTAYVLIAVFVGEILGWAANLLGLSLYLKSARRNKEFPGQPIPESRLYISILGSFFGITGGMFVYGWTSYSYIHWIFPCIGLAMVGFGIQTVVAAACDYLEDAYAESDYAATAVGALAFLENIFGSFLPFAAMAMYTNLGFQWASTLLGILAVLISVGPMLFTWKGQWFRQRSPFMSSGGTSHPGLTTNQARSRSTLALSTAGSGQRSQYSRSEVNLPNADGRSSRRVTFSGHHSQSSRSEINLDSTGHLAPPLPSSPAIQRSSSTPPGNAEALEIENTSLKMYMLELQRQLRENGLEPKALSRSQHSRGRSGDANVNGHSRSRSDGNLNVPGV